MSTGKIIVAGIGPGSESDITPQCYLPSGNRTLSWDTNITSGSLIR